MKMRWFIGFAAGATLVAALVGCVQVSMEQRPAPARRYFALDAKVAHKTAQSNSSGVLKLAPIRVAHPYDSKGFIYRIGSESFETDFYNHFLAAPGPMVTDELRQVLDQANVFQAVVDSTSLVEATYMLEGTVDELYGDFRDDDLGEAVLSMSFVMREAGSDRPIIFHKQYGKTIPLQARSPEGLVRGWNQALSEIMSALLSDLRATKGI